MMVSSPSASAVATFLSLGLFVFVMIYRNLLFYEYQEVQHPEVFRDELKALCQELELLGKIIIAPEGINGSVSGSFIATAELMRVLNSYFPRMEFKQGLSDDHTFTRLVLRVKQEIVSFKQPVSLENKAPYIDPIELKQLLDNNEEVILVDARNTYESEIGSFKNAVKPDIQLFREFVRVAKDLQDKKDAPIVTFCTGGIRCEKASAFLVEQGFTNVRQLHGGILTYGKEVGSAHWEGECFVYDERLSVRMDNPEELHPNKEKSNERTAVYFKRALGVE